jgi:hypothetical protein
LSVRNAFAEHCRHVCASQNWELLPTGIVVRFGDGRHQLVALEFFEYLREELVRLSTTIGPVESLGRSQLVLTLETNSRLPHGAFSIRGGNLCMTDTLMIETSGPAEIEAAVDYLARTADEHERLLFGSDEH